MTTLSADYSNELPAGQSAVIYMDVTFGAARDVPKVIAHRAALSRGQAQPPPTPAIYPDPPVNAIAACSKVSKPGPVVVSPPLEGDRWLDANGCCLVVGPHRYAILPLNGTLRSPERFAIDYLHLVRPMWDAAQIRRGSLRILRCPVRR